jgi:ATP-dependent protease ClpP protease subunit
LKKFPIKNNDTEENIDNLKIDKDDLSLTNNLYVNQIAVCREYIFFLDEEVLEAKEYRAFYKVCKNATEYDIVKIVFNSVGGFVSSLIQLFNCLLTTKAKTIAEIYEAHSAAFSLALSCDEIIVMKHANAMIHSLSFGTQGKAHNVQDQANMIDKQNNLLLQDICKGFLTQEEIKQVVEGKDIWFLESEIIKRLKNWIPYRYRVTEDKSKKGKTKK